MNELESRFFKNKKNINRAKQTKTKEEINQNTWITTSFKVNRGKKLKISYGWLIISATIDKQVNSFLVSRCFHKAPRWDENEIPIDKTQLKAKAMTKNATGWNRFGLSGEHKKKKNVKCTRASFFSRVDS